MRLHFHAWGVCRFQSDPGRVAAVSKSSTVKKKKPRAHITVQRKGVTHEGATPPTLSPEKWGGSRVKSEGKMGEATTPCSSTTPSTYLWRPLGLLWPRRRGAGWIARARPGAGHVVSILMPMHLAALLLRGRRSVLVLRLIAVARCIDPLPRATPCPWCLGAIEWLLLVLLMLLRMLYPPWCCALRRRTLPWWASAHPAATHWRVRVGGRWGAHAGMMAHVRPRMMIPAKVVRGVPHRIELPIGMQGIGGIHPALLRRPAVVEVCLRAVPRRCCPSGASGGSAGGSWRVRNGARR